MLFVETEGLSYEDHRHMVDYESFYFAQDSIIPAEIRYRWYQFNKYTMVTGRGIYISDLYAHPTMPEG
jgi:hypothetical protein